MGDTYDKNSESGSKYIAYLDVNALYAYAMQQKLPTGDFVRMDQTELDNWKAIPCV